MSLVWYGVHCDLDFFNCTLFNCLLLNCFFSTDVAIGAPQEDNLKGVIYIYNGREDGITPTYSQVCIFSGKQSIQKNLKFRFKRVFP